MNEDNELVSRCSKSYMIENLDSNIKKNIDDKVFGKLLEKHKPIIESARARTEAIYSKTRSRMRRDFWLIPLLFIIPLSMGLLLDLGSLTILMLFCTIFVLPTILQGKYNNYTITYESEALQEGALSEYFQKLKANADDLTVSELSCVCFKLEQWIPYTYCDLLDTIERDKNNNFHHYSHFLHQEEFTEIKRSLFQFKEEEKEAQEMHESLIVDAYEEFVLRGSKEGTLSPDSSHH